MSATPPILWAPDEARDRARHDHPLRAAGSRRPAASRPRGYPRPLALVRDRARGVLGLDLGVLRRARVASYGASSTPARCRARDGSPGAAPQLRGARFRSRDPRDDRDPARLELRPLAETTWGELAEATRRTAAALRARRRRAGRPRRRLPPEHPRGGRRVPRLREPRRDLVELLAGLRRAQRRRPLRADRAARALAVDGYRYGGRDHDRLDVVARAAGGDADLERTVVLGYLDLEPSLDGLGRRPGGTTSSPRATTSRSRSPRSPSTIRSGCSTARGRPGLPKAIVHGHGGILLEHLKKLHLHVDLQEDDRLFWFTTTGWMMWNFVVGRPAHRRVDRALRRQPRASRPRHALGPRRGGRDHVLRHLGELRRRLHEGRRRAARGRDLSRSWRSGRPGRRSRPRASTGSTTQLGPDCGSSRRRAARTSARRSSAACPTLPVYRGELQARALGAKVEAWTPTACPSSARSASS